MSDVLAGRAPEHIVSAQLTPDGDMVLACQENLQSPISWHYLDLETGEIEDITDIVPASDGQLASIYCTPLGGGVLAFYAAGEYPEGTSNYVELVYRTDINEGTLARIGREDDMDHGRVPRGELLKVCAHAAQHRLESCGHLTGRSLARHGLAGALHGLLQARTAPGPYSCSTRVPHTAA